MGKRENLISLRKDYPHKDLEIKKIIELSKRFHSPHGLDRYLSTLGRMSCHSNALLFPEKQEAAGTTPQKQ